MSETSHHYTSEETQKIKAIAGHMQAIMELLGEDTSREGLIKTPLRSARALWYLTSGYRTDASELISQALFTHEGSQMVIVKDIEYYSMCEHHVLPFFGKISIGYIPDGKIIGLSKLARVVNAYARRLQVQERLTSQVCSEIFRTAGAKGVIAVSNAHHMCMKMRGVEKQESTTSTVDYVGVFETDTLLREEFFNSLRAL